MTCHSILVASIFQAFLSGFSLPHQPIGSFHLKLMQGRGLVAGFFCLLQVLRPLIITRRRLYWTVSHLVVFIDNSITVGVGLGVRLG